MDNLKPVTLSALLGPFVFLYYCFCALLIFIFSVIDTTQSLAETSDWCANVQGFDGLDGDVTQGFSAFVTALFIAPLLFFFPTVIKKKNYSRCVVFTVIAVYWGWTFFGRFWFC